jgi:hypothetical protein
MQKQTTEEPSSKVEIDSVSGIVDKCLAEVNGNPCWRDSMIASVLLLSTLL